jgi:hypothetical protein
MLRMRERCVASTDSCSSPPEYPPIPLGARYIVPVLLFGPNATSSAHPNRKYHTQCWPSIWYNFRIMQTARKITVEIPEDLLEKAQQASGTGVTQTVRTGLELLAASHAYARLRQFRGKVRFSRMLAQLKDDR